MQTPTGLSAVLLDQVCCPATFQTLREADDDTLRRLNARIEQGDVKNVGGATITQPLTAGLVRADGALVYPVAQPRPNVFIPRLLADEGIAVEG